AADPVAWVAAEGPAGMGVSARDGGATGCDRSLSMCRSPIDGATVAEAAGRSGRSMRWGTRGRRSVFFPDSGAAVATRGGGPPVTDGWAPGPAIPGRTVTIPSGAVTEAPPTRNTSRIVVAG